MQNGAREQADVIVIGGGLAGLAAAAYLARAGRSVTVYERSSHVGGRAITNDLNGFRFNFGPHALYRKGAGASVLRELGVSYRGAVPPTNGYAIRGGALHYISQSPLWFLTTGMLSARGKVEAVRTLLAVRRMDPRAVKHLSAREWLDREVCRPEVRELVEALTRVATYANDSAHLSAEVAVMQLQLAQHGVLYLDGGWQTLVDGLSRAAEQAGVRIKTGASVESVEHDGAVRAVRLKDGRTISASAAVIAAGPDVAAELVGGDTIVRRWAEAAVPVRAACLDVGLRRLPRPRQTFTLGLDEPLYFSVHSRTAKLAPEGAAAIHVAKYLAPDDSDAKRHERELEACLDLVQPGWRDELVERRYLPNMVVVGATATAEHGGIAGRPGPDVPGIEHLYAAGDWVGPEGWLSDASLASAKRAAELIIAKAPASARARLSVASRAPVAP